MHPVGSLASANDVGSTSLARGYARVYMTRLAYASSKEGGLARGILELSGISWILDLPDRQ